MAAITVVNGASSPTTTYADGPGNPNQRRLVYAISSGVWWYFQVNSANDATGNPGTHKVSAWYNSSGDPGSGSWTYYGDSPNLTGNLETSNSKFQNGRNVGALYWNNSGGTNKDICHIFGAIAPPASVSPDTGLIGNLRVILGASSLTWGSWGCWVTASLPIIPANCNAAPCCARSTDGYINSASGLWCNEDFDAAAVVSKDADTSDSWTTGGQGTGNITASSATITSLSNETGMAVGYGLGGGAGGGSWSGIAATISSIDSGTQIHASSNSSASVTGALVGWTNMQAGTRPSTIIDSSMANECNSMALAPLASGAMLAVYDDGSNASPPNFSQLNHIKASGAKPNFWPNAGGGDGAVFSSSSSQADNDWCLCGVSTSAIYCARRSSTTVCQVRNYNTSTNAWQAITNAPPTMTGKTIVAGGGVCLVSDGTDMWLLVIDSTDAQVKYVKYTHGGTTTSGTWGSWTNLASVGATAAYLTASVGNGYLAAAWTEKNADATHYDTKTASLSVGGHAGSSTLFRRTLYLRTGSRGVA